MSLLSSSTVTKILFTKLLFRKWEGVWNGCSRTTAAPQDSQMVDLFLEMKSVMAMQEKEMKLLTSSQPMVQGKSVNTVMTHTV